MLWGIKKGGVMRDPYLYAESNILHSFYCIVQYMCVCVYAHMCELGAWWTHHAADKWLKSTNGTSWGTHCDRDKLEFINISIVKYCYYTYYRRCVFSIYCNEEICCIRLKCSQPPKLTTQKTNYYFLQLCRSPFLCSREAKADYS